jgi:hypothetical protein
MARWLHVGRVDAQLPEHHMTLFEEGQHRSGVVHLHLYTCRVYFQIYPVGFAPGKLSTSSEVVQLSQRCRVPTRRVKASTAPGFSPGFCFG